MKKPKKITLSIVAIVIALVFLTFFGASYVLYRGVAGSLSTDFSYFQTMKGLITQNGEGDNEKARKIKQDYRNQPEIMGWVRQSC